MQRETSTRFGPGTEQTIRLLYLRKESHVGTGTESWAGPRVDEEMESKTNREFRATSAVTPLREHVETRL